MMKKLVTYLFFCSLFLVAAALLVPSFLNWNAYKDKIIAKLEPYLDRQIQVGGGITFKIIPNPHLTLENVWIANPENARQKNLLSLEKLEATVKLKPLLEGRIEVDSVTLIKPVLNLEIMPDGRPGWKGIVKEQSRAAATNVLSLADNIQLNKITISDGTMRYMNPSVNVEWQMEHLNADIAADTLLGPYHVSGDMSYQNVPVKIDLNTGVYDETSGTTSLRLDLKPEQTFPSVNLDGVLSLQQGLDVQGELQTGKGRLASFLTSPRFQSLPFMQEESSLRGILNLTKGQCTLSDIKAKIGPKGSVSGKVNLQFVAGQETGIGTDLEGQGVVWQGVAIPRFILKAQSQQQEWSVSDAQFFDLPGKTTIQLSGIAAPQDRYFSGAIHLATADLPAAMQMFSLSDQDKLKILQDIPVIRKLDLKTNATIKPEQVHLADVSAMADDTTKIEGFLNLDQKNPYHADLSVENIDVTGQGWADLFHRLENTDGDVELNLKQVMKKKAQFKEVLFKGKTGAAGLEIGELTVKVSDADQFTIKGIKSDLSFAVKSSRLGDVLDLFDIDAPPPLKESYAVDVSGQWKASADGTGNEFNLSGAVQGLYVDLSGKRTVSPDGAPARYQNNLRLKGESVLGFLGLPFDAVVQGKTELSGGVSGTSKHFAIDSIKISQSAVTGSIGREGGKTKGSFALGDIDPALWNKMNFLAQDDFDLQLTGKVWGGDMEASISSGHMKGSIKSADLNQVQKMLGLSGFSVEEGDIDFDVMLPPGKINSLAQAAAGHIEITTGQLTLDRFNTKSLASLLAQVKPPFYNLAEMVSLALKFQGNSTYYDVVGEFDLKDGKLNIRKLKLADIGADVVASGLYDGVSKTYDIMAALELHKPEGLPAITLSRAGGAKVAPDYAIDTDLLERYLTEHAIPAEAPQAVNVPKIELKQPTPPIKNENKISNENNTIRDIIKRLDEDGPETLLPAPEEEILPP